MRSLAELVAYKEQVLAARNPNAIKINVGMATCGIAAGAGPVFDAFIDEAQQRQLTDVEVYHVGCMGACRLEPMADIYINGVKTTYVHLDADKAREIVEKHILGGNIVKEYTIGYADGVDCDNIDGMDFYKRQTRIALRNCGFIDPENIDDYIAKDGYVSLIKAVTDQTPEWVIEQMKISGIQGRGGAGFPTHMKWSFAAKAKGDEKFVICNADEGDPGAFMDRAVLEGDPHSVLEAMALAAYAIGGTQGYIYCRAEYPVAVKRLNIAIDQARKQGLLGKNLFGTNFSFDIEVRLGAGAFVCGEETALITSIEGFRGEPRPKPPFPANKGLFGKPTIVNNVETLANIPAIFLKGAEWFASMGTEKCKGTKVFALAGKIKNAGLVEIPMGTPLREVIFNIGGGIPNGKAFKAAQTGGPSGGCIPAKYLDVEIDYNTLKEIGSMMGSGGLIVIDEDNCMVDIARFFLDFTCDESCGKCVACRVGTKRMMEILDRIISGQGKDGDIELLHELASNISLGALCALGQTAPNPVLSTIKHFRDEYDAHILEKRCPAGVCRSLLAYSIDPVKCKGCSLCSRVCPVDAISGELKKPFSIDLSKCIKCGACMEKCKFGAIEKK